MAPAQRIHRVNDLLTRRRIQDGITLQIDARALYQSDPDGPASRLACVLRRDQHVPTQLRKHEESGIPSWAPMPPSAAALPATISSKPRLAHEYEQPALVGELNHRRRTKRVGYHALQFEAADGCASVRRVLFDTMREPQHRAGRAKALALLRVPAFRGGGDCRVPGSAATLTCRADSTRDAGTAVLANPGHRVAAPKQ